MFFDPVPKKIFMSAITPRPIFWISTLNNGEANLAPYSFSQGVSSNPPLVITSGGKKEYGDSHTMKNIQETGEYVINLVTEELVDQMMQTSASVEEDEFAFAKVERIPSRKVKPPGVKKALIRLECRFVKTIPLENADSTLILGEVIGAHVDDSILNNDEIDWEKYRPVARLGKNFYAIIKDVFQKDRP